MHGSDAEYVCLHLHVAMFLRPQVQRNCRELVYDWHSIAVLCEINGLDVTAARVACFNPDMAELLRGVNRKLLDAILTASGTQDPANWPLG